ncbi:hypothetical protein [Microbacterium sp.]|uniref:hypothetical protein n=1 Tax=Microbacterium sp. TaxID=51671 RepID=UPI0039E35446
MRVNCVANDPKALADHQQSRAVPFEGVYPLTVGKVYVAVGMTIAERALYFLVRDDSGGPSFVPAGFFELFTAPIPEGWRFGLELGIRATGRELWAEPGVATWGYPELVEDPAHVQSLFEFDPDALDVFEAHIAAAEAAS